MLEELEQQKKELLAKLHDVQKQINEEKTAAAYRNFGVRVGSVVRDPKGVEYKVFAIDLVFYSRQDDKPSLKCNLKKKDGTFGVARRDLYRGWTLVTS